MFGDIQVVVEQGLGLAIKKIQVAHRNLGNGLSRGRIIIRRGQIYGLQGIVHGHCLRMLPIA
jgi:hypothetical protein